MSFLFLVNCIIPHAYSSFLAFIPLITALCTTNFYLGNTQNAVDGKVHPMYGKNEGVESDSQSQSEGHDEKQPVPEESLSRD